MTAALWCLGAASALMAQEPVAADKDDQIRQVAVGQSAVIDTSWPVKRVAVTEPKIADVQLITPRQVMVLGKSVGVTDVQLWNESETMQRVRVEVTADLSLVRAELVKLLPGSSLEVIASRGAIVVQGTLARAEQAAVMRRFLETTVGKYVDATRVAGVHQVQIQVRVAEVSRTALRVLGVNGFVGGDDFFGGVTVGSSTGGPINPINAGAQAGQLASASSIPLSFNDNVNVSSSVTVFGGFPEVPLQLFLQALAENQYLRILAEPNLVALSGEEANFLAGGEYPIPIVQGSSVGGGTAITIEYREFGVRLKFRPIVLGDNTIRLFVSPEVSELSDVGAVVIQGFRIPSVVTRRASTTLELKSGQTFAMAGLISTSSTATNARVPGIGDVPILGALFRSVRYTRGETELVVMVTASLVEPSSYAQAPPLPGAKHKTPNDWELYALGQVESREPAKLSAYQAAWIKQMGLDRLQGPGAWATYEQPAAPGRATELTESTGPVFAPVAAIEASSQPAEKK